MDNLLSSTFFKCCFCKLLTKIVNRESITSDEIKSITIDSEIKNLFNNDNIVTLNNMFTNNSFAFNSFMPRNNQSGGYFTNHESTYGTQRVNRALFTSPDTRTTIKVNSSGKD
jgi:hypothetical protein